MVHIPLQGAGRKTRLKSIKSRSERPVVPDPTNKRKSPASSLRCMYVCTARPCTTLPCQPHRQFVGADDDVDGNLITTSRRPSQLLYLFILLLLGRDFHNSWISLDLLIVRLLQRQCSCPTFRNHRCGYATWLSDISASRPEELGLGSR